MTVALVELPRRPGELRVQDRTRVTAMCKHAFSHLRSPEQLRVRELVCAQRRPAQRLVHGGHHLEVVLEVARALTKQPAQWEGEGRCWASAEVPAAVPVPAAHLGVLSSGLTMPGYG